MAAAANKRQTAARGLIEAAWFHVEVSQSYAELGHSLNARLTQFRFSGVRRALQFA